MSLMNSQLNEDRSVIPGVEDINTEYAMTIN